MNTGLTKKLIAFVLTAMLAVTFSTPAFAASENVSAANSGATVSSDTLKTDGEDPATGWVVIGDETYYQDEEGMRAYKNVVVGLEADKMIEVVSGLEEGDLVIVK